ILFDPGLSEALWGSADFGWVVSLAEVQALPSVSEEAVRAAAGVARGQMAMPVPQARLEDAQELVGAAELTPVTAVSSLAQIDPDAPLSAWAIAERRNEQSILRNAVIRGEIASCDFCGNDYPATFLRAAHAKKRALCSDTERRDVTNVLAA